MEWKPPFSVITDTDRESWVQDAWGDAVPLEEIVVRLNREQELLKVVTHIADEGYQSHNNCNEHLIKILDEHTDSARKVLGIKE